MKDRIVQYPNRYRDKNTGQVLDLEPHPGIVSEPGTPINKATLLSDVTSKMYGRINTVDEALQMAYNGDDTVILVLNLTDPVTGDAMPSGVQFKFDGTLYTTDGNKTSMTLRKAPGTYTLEVLVGTALPLGYKAGTQYMLLIQGEGVRFKDVFGIATLPVTYTLTETGNYPVASFLQNKVIDVFLCGGGAGGAGGQGNSKYGGGGGGGGRVSHVLGRVIQSAFVVLGIGAGGKGGAVYSNGSKGSYSDLSISTSSGLLQMMALGGDGGIAGPNSYNAGNGGNGGSGGAGGSSSGTPYGGGSDGSNGGGYSPPGGSGASIQGKGDGVTTKPFKESGQIPYCAGGASGGTGGAVGGGSGQGGHATQFGGGGAGNSVGPGGDGFAGVCIIRFREV